ncbi:MAG: CHC2 zinc finger domain-containing protein, partial [Smithella sp.]
MKTEYARNAVNYWFIHVERILIVKTVDGLMRILMNLNVLDLAQQKVILKKVSSTGGGEWQGPCPECGGTDRFHVWPEKNGQGAYWCRGCGKTGDAIQFLRDFEGKSFKEACDYLNITMDEKNYTTPAPKKEKPVFEPIEHQSPADIWQERAQKFVSWAQENLKQNQVVMAWLAARGINAAAVDKYRLGWNPGENGKDIYRPRQTWGLPAEIKQETGRPKKLWIPIGLVIPYFVIPAEAGIQETKQSILSVQIRRPDEILERLRREQPDREHARYVNIKGSSSTIMILGMSRRAFVIVESKLDAITCYESQELCGSVALGSATNKPDKFTYAILRDSTQILNALDYDKAGATAMQWWKEQFPDNCDRWPVPQGKDPGEAYQLGTDLKSWIEAGLPPSITVQSSTFEVQSLKVEEKKECHCETSPASRGNLEPSAEISPLLLELHSLLKSNPAVKII